MFSKLLFQKYIFKSTFLKKYLFKTAPSKNTFPKLLFQIYSLSQKKKKFKIALSKLLPQKIYFQKCFLKKILFQNCSLENH